LLNLENPKEWKRKINHLKKCLPQGSPYIKKVTKAFCNWEKIYAQKSKYAGAGLSDTLPKAAEILYDRCIEAESEIERKIEEKRDRKRWFATTVVSIIAMVVTASSLFINTYYQSENLLVNKERLSISLEEAQKIEMKSLEKPPTKPKEIAKETDSDKIPEPAQNKAIKTKP
jgi:hypothetical protein